MSDDKIEKTVTRLPVRTPDDREQERREQWLAKRVPITMEVLADAANDQIAPADFVARAVNELYERLDPLGGANRDDIDDTLGKGMADLIETEGDMADGGVFGGGGISAGGIFGEGPVATNLNDPAAEQRTASADATRALLGGGHRPKSLPTEARKALVDDRRRERMLKGRKKDDDDDGS